MKRVFSLCAVVALVAACDPKVPDSAPPTQGPGFRNYDTVESERAARDAALTGRTTISGPAPILTTPLDENGEAVAVTPLNADEVRAATASGDLAQTPSPTVANEYGISTENNFEAVSSERSIESDARRIAQTRAQYEIVQPTALPERRAAGPNIVAFALQTTNRRGEPLYKRNTFGAERKFARACAQYASGDQAQIAFLASGGPQRDKYGMDPDGDGFACSWDPAPYRAVKTQVAGR